MLTKDSPSNSDRNAPEAVQNAFASPCCAHCGRTGWRRNSRFCSDMCRMHAYRRAKKATIAGLFATIAQAITELKSALGDDYEL